MAPELCWTRRVSVLSGHLTAGPSQTSEIGLAECAASQAVLFARPAVDDIAYARPSTFDTKADEPPAFARTAAFEDNLRRDHGHTRSHEDHKPAAIFKDSPPRFSRPATPVAHSSKLVIGRPRIASAPTTPQVKTRETRNYYIIEARLPGVKAGDLQLRLQGNGLVLLGVKDPLASDAMQQGGKAKPFSATWPLPPAVDGTKITARHKGDRLLIILPKRI